MKCTLQAVPQFNSFRLKEKKSMIYLSFKKDERHLYKSDKINLIFVMKGVITVSYDLCKNSCVSKDSIFLIPADKMVYVIAKEDCVCVNIPFCSLAQYYDRKMMVPYLQTLSNYKYQIKTLKFNDLVKVLFKLVLCYIDDKIVCDKLIVYIKMEISWILTNFYSPKDLAEFVCICYNEDDFFKESVLDNYLKVTTVTALCRLLGYSRAVFNSKIKYCFNEVPSEWFKRKREDAILQDIHTTKAISEIASLYHFKSLLQFNAYCKKTYGLAPKKLRVVIDKKRTVPTRC